MENWRNTREKLLDQNNHEVLIASHRGKFSSSVMENTTLAFQIAIKQGAHMVEMDLEKTKDGRIVAHHDNTIERLFHRSGAIEDYSLEELLNFPMYNYIGEIGVEHLETFDEILAGLKDQTILVLDKCWDCWDDVYTLIKEQGMLDQVIFKFYLKDEKAFLWAKNHPDCMFIPMCGDVALFPRLEELKEAGQVPALEILPRKVTDPIFQDSVFQWLRDHEIKVWCNSLSLAKRLVYGAGYDDLKSLYEGGDQGWGELMKKGVTIIQTDWPFELKCYLDSICTEKDH